MPKYIVKSPVKHDGKRYGVGMSITLKADEADRLLDGGVIEDDRESAADRKTAERKAAEEAATARKAAEEAEAARKAAEEAEAAAAADPDKQG